MMWGVPPITGNLQMKNRTFQDPTDGGHVHQSKCAAGRVLSHAVVVAGHARWMGKHLGTIVPLEASRLEIKKSLPIGVSHVSRGVNGVQNGTGKLGIILNQSTWCSFCHEDQLAIRLW